MGTRDVLESNLLATKLHRPSPPARWVRRPHLPQRLNEGLALERQVTLVSAPAGFGKTTCVGEWVDGLERPVAWLSLDAADDDPGRFFAYTVAALQRVDAALGRELGAVLRSGQLPPAEAISASLINDVLNLDKHLLLVLDDFHVIQDRFILTVLENMAANMPRSLHLVLITREDPPLPLARLRANNRLTEIRARDLRFAASDIARFCNETMGLSLSQTDIARLEEKTEGWIAGLQLAALSALDQADPTAFISALSGSHRFILRYLTEQVLDQQPQAIRHFLLETSILERLSGDLCDAVTGRSDSARLLEQLYSANLFLIPLDDEGRWYRYHHLFADLLRDLGDTRQKEKTADLHRRASGWYAKEEGLRQGEHGAFAGEAIRHALAAGDYALAVQLLERHAMALIMQGHAKTVNGWVQALPAGWAGQSPRTDLALAWMHLLRGAYAGAKPYLARTKSLLDGDEAGAQATEERKSLRAEWLVMNALLLLMADKAAEGRVLAEEALALAPETDSRVRSMAYWAVASVDQLTAAYAAAAEGYRMAIRYARAADNAVAEMMAVSGLAQMALEQGQLHPSFEIATQAVERIERAGVLPPISAVAYGALAQIHYEWHELEGARGQGQRTLELATLGGFNSGIAFSRVFFSRLSQLEGHLELAAWELQRAVDLVQGDVPDYVRQEVIAQQVRIYLAQDRLAAAQIVLQGQGFAYQSHFRYPDLSGQRMTHSLGLLFNSALRVLLYQARSGDGSGLALGIELADRLIARARQDQFLLVELEALLLRAQMHAEAGPGDDHLAPSRADYEAALARATAEGFIGVFLDQGPAVAGALAHLLRQNQLAQAQAAHARRILDAFAQSPAQALAPDAGPPLVEPLTERELEVLSLMAQGLTYKEIAAALFISLNTVRFHVKGIYGKLQVGNRTQAVATARQQGIL